MEKIKIGDRLIGKGEPCFIIAEAGVNHNGDFEMAKALIEKAHECGADCIKFQTFKAERVVTKEAPKAKYQLRWTNPGESQLEMLRKMELKPEFYAELIRCAKKIGIIFMSTPYNFEDIDFLESIGVPAYKIASGQIIEIPFIKKIARIGKPVFLSTGLATMQEVKEAVDAIQSENNNKIVLLQCTTNYPSSINDANLNVIGTYKKNFSFFVGYSDHTTDELAAIIAVAIGAKVIEKHFTLDKKLPGPDHSSSMTPSEFSDFVKKIRTVNKALGSACKKPTETEKENAISMRRSIVAKRTVKKGSTIVEGDITFKRPLTGLSPGYYYKLLGKKASRDIRADEILTEEMIEW